MTNLYRLPEKKIVLYGTGALSCKVEELLASMNLDIVCYIDARAREIKEFHGRTVYEIVEASKAIKEKESFVVIITTKNVFEHSTIANDLLKGGFANIIYKDCSVLQGGEGNSIDKAFECLLNMHKLPDFEIHSVDKVSDFQLKDYGLIQTKEKEVSAYLHASLLFSNPINMNYWSRVNICACYLTVDLFKSFFKGKEPDFSTNGKFYLDYFAKEGAKNLELSTSKLWESYVIDGRLEVFRQMLNTYSLYSDFFVMNAPKVRGSAQEGFELITSGKNRVSFLIAMGKRYIPVKMDEETYNNYINLKVLNEMEYYIKHNDIQQLFTPIVHPYFYQFPTIASDYYELWLERVSKIIANKLFSDMNSFSFNKATIEVLCNDEGNAERYFGMLGMKVIAERNGDKFTDLVDQLLRKEKVYYSDDSEIDFSIIFGIQETAIPIILSTGKMSFVGGKSEEVVSVLDHLKGRTEYSYDEIFSTIWSKEKYIGVCISMKE